MAGATYIEYEYVKSKSGKKYPFVGYLVNEFVGILCSMPIKVPEGECEFPNGLEEVLNSADDFYTVSTTLGKKLNNIHNISC